MSVSSHLSPEPERRLWLIHERVRAEAERAGWRLAALGAFALWRADAGSDSFARAAFAATAMLGLAGLLPLGRPPQALPLLDPKPEKPSVDNSLVSEEDIIKYAYGELVLKLDRYLGGGITATRYYEDLIAEIARAARDAARKKRLLTAAVVLAALGLITA